MSQIIAFSGSHGVGKTTLINKIAEELDYKIKVFKEINTGLANLGFSLNAHGYDFHEVMFSQKQAFDLSYKTLRYYLSRDFDERIIVSDRSCFDTYIYTAYFIEQKPQYQTQYDDLLQNMRNKSKEILAQLIHIFLPPFVDFEELENRMNINERNLIWQKFLDYLQQNSSHNAFILTSNTSALRVKELNLIMSSKFKP